MGSEEAKSQQLVVDAVADEYGLVGRDHVWLRLKTGDSQTELRMTPEIAKALASKAEEAIEAFRGLRGNRR